MKAIFIFLCGFFLFLESSSAKELKLLIAKRNFKFEIMDCITQRKREDSDIILINFKKISTNKETKRTPKFEIRFTLVDKNTFDALPIRANEYQGFFEYKSHEVLVYGDESYNYFFTKSQEIKKAKKFVFKSHDYEKNPPPSLEQPACLYIYAKGNFILSSQGIF